MTSVAVVRGATISPWEMHGFAPLAGRFDVTLVGARSARSRGEAYPFPVTWLGETRERIERIPIPQIRWRVRRGFEAADRQHELQGLDRALRGAQLVHTVDFHYAFSGQAADYAARVGIPLVVTRWENVPFMYWRFGGEAARARYARVAAAARCIVATSRGAADSLATEGTSVRRVEVLYPGIDVTRFSPGARDVELTRSMALEEASHVILLVGRVCWEKGWLDALLAFRALLDRFPRAVLVMAGSGPDADMRDDVVARLGLKDQVRIRAQVPYSELPALHRLADVFVLPSIPTVGWEEQFGMVLGEAMATGSPLVTTRCGAIPEVVGEAGVVVEPHAPAALATAVGRLLADPARRADLSARARARAVTEFDAARFAAGLGEIYASLT